MSLDSKAQMLEAVVSGPQGVRELIRKLRWRPLRVTYVLKEMRDEGLIELRQAKPSSRGRPKMNIVCTTLGLDFLETYRRLKTKPLRARKEDLERAARDALYAERLAANQRSPFKLFLELNAIVNNIKIAS